MGVAIKKLTWDDIKDLPEGTGRTEIVSGELVMSPTPSFRHQKICTALGLEIGPFVRGRGFGEFVSSPIHVILAEDVHYEPDLCFVAKQRPSIIQEQYIEGPPDLIIEVISESNRSHDTVVKFNDYQKYGVREYWLVDPRENHIRVFFLEGAEYQLIGVFGPGDQLESRVLPELRMDPANVLEG